MWGGICTNPIFPLLQISFTPIKGEHGPLCILAIPVTVVQPGFVNRWGAKARERSDREGFFLICVWKRHFLHMEWHYYRGLVMWSDIYQSPTPPSFEKLFYSNQGGGSMAPCALSYASEGGAARTCQRGAKARERSDRAGEGVGFPLPR